MNGTKIILGLLACAEGCILMSGDRQYEQTPQDGSADSPSAVITEPSLLCSPAPQVSETVIIRDGDGKETVAELSDGKVFMAYGARAVDVGDSGDANLLSNKIKYPVVEKYRIDSNGDIIPEVIKQ